MACGPSAHGSEAARAASLLFSLEDVNFERLAQTAIEDAEQYDPVSEIAQVKQACVYNDEVAKLVSALQDAKTSSVSAIGMVDMAYVGSYLRSKHGYFILLRTANIAKRPRSYLRMLRHSYLVCRGIEGVGGADVLIDINFKDHFILPHATTWYSKLLAALPQDWVGTAASLAPLVGLMSAGIRLCFRQAGIPLPPWREGRAVLSKWVPDVFEEAALPIVPLPDPTLKRMLAPYHAPFRAAVRAAAAVQASETEAMVCQQQLPGHVQLGRQQLPVPGWQVALSHTIGVGGKVARVSGEHAALLLQGHGAVYVPRRIIVGFPELHFGTANEGPATATPLPVQLQQQVQVEEQTGQQQQQQRFWLGKCTQLQAGATLAADAAVGAKVTPGLPVVSTSDQQADATMHGGNLSGALEPVLPAFPTPVLTTAAADEQKKRSGALSPAGALTRPNGGPGFAAAATAGSSSRRRSPHCPHVAAAKGAAQRGCSPIVDLTPAASSLPSRLMEQCWQQSQGSSELHSKQTMHQHTQQQQQQQSYQGQPGTTRASQDGDSCEVGCSSHTVLGAIHRQAAPTGSPAAAAMSCGSSPGLAINRAWLKQQLGQQVSAAGSTSAALAAKAGDGSQGMFPHAGGDKGPALRQFKTLDQLLPRMRIVKLGVV